MDDQNERQIQPPTDDETADEQLQATADSWREALRGTEAEESADEVARGAEDAARQPGYGREGS